MCVASFKSSHTIRPETALRNERIPVPPYSGRLPERVKTVAIKEMASSNPKLDLRESFGMWAKNSPGKKMERNFPPQKNPPPCPPVTSSSSGLKAPPTSRKNSCDSVQPFHMLKQVGTASSKVWSMPIAPLPYRDDTGMQKPEKNLTFLRVPPSRPPVPSSYISSGLKAPHPRLRKDSYDSVQPFHRASQVTMPSLSLPCKDLLGAELERDTLSLPQSTSTSQADPSRVFREGASDDEEDLARRVVDFVLSDEKPGKGETSGAKEGEDTPPKHKTKRIPPPAPQMTPYISNGVRAPYRERREILSDDEEEARTQTVWQIQPKRRERELEPYQVFQNGSLRSVDDTIRSSDGRIYWKEMLLDGRVIWVERLPDGRT